MMDDDDQQHCVLPMDVDFGGSSPGWIVGQQGFSFLYDGRLVAVFKREGESVLVVVNIMDWNPRVSTTQHVAGTYHSYTTTTTSIPTPVDSVEYNAKDGLPIQFGPVQGGTTTDTMNDLYFMGGSSSIPTSVYHWKIPPPPQTQTQAKSKKGQSQPHPAATTVVPATILAHGSPIKFPDSIISVPKQIEFPTTFGWTAFGYYYPPKNNHFHCTTEMAPPLLVKAHVPQVVQKQHFWQAFNIGRHVDLLFWMLIMVVPQDMDDPTVVVYGISGGLWILMMCAMVPTI